MHCTHVIEHLNALADNEVTLLTKLRLGWHLKRCPACATEFSEIRSISERAREWRAVAVPEALRARVLGSIPEAEISKHAVRGPRRAGFRQGVVRHRFAIGLACLLLLHWAVVGRLDAQRVNMLMPPDQNAAVFAAAPPTDAESVSNTFAWRSQMLASLLDRNEINMTLESKEVNRDPQPTNVPERSSANSRSRQNC